MLMTAAGTVLPAKVFRVSIDWARVMRGMPSVEKAVIPRPARRAKTSPLRSGTRPQSSMAPRGRRPTSCTPRAAFQAGGCTFSTRSASPNASAASVATAAPASR